MDMNTKEKPAQGLYLWELALLAGLAAVLLCGALSLSMILALAACGSGTTTEESGDAQQASGDVPVIGICQYGQHGSLDNCREGFLQGLEQAGLVEGTDYTIDYQNASFDDNMAIQIAQASSAEDARTAIFSVLSLALLRKSVSPRIHFFRSR